MSRSKIPNVSCCRSPYTASFAARRVAASTTLIPFSKRPGVSQTVSAPTLVVSGPSSARNPASAAAVSPSITRRSMLAGSRRGSATLPSVAITTRASRRRASWRMARSTTRRPPTRMRAPTASSSVATKITGITLDVEATGARDGTTAATRGIELSSVAPSIITRSIRPFDLMPQRRGDRRMPSHSYIHKRGKARRSRVFPYGNVARHHSGDGSG